MFQIKDFNPRPYQVAISNQASNNNTLAVLPTGLGKTKIAILTSINRLNNIENSKVLICTPTKPLSAQIHKEFITNTDLQEQRISLLTGHLKPDKRKQLWDLSYIIIATPQCVTGETQIFSEKDGPIKISKFFKGLKLKKDSLNGKPALSCKINENILGYATNEIKLLKAIKGWKTSSKLLRVKTELGIGLKCTPEHPLLNITPKGKIIWKEARNLKVNDFIGTIRGISLKEKKQNLYEFCKTNELRIKDKKPINKLIKSLKAKKVKISKLSNYYTNISFPLKTYLELSKKHNIRLPNHITLTNKTGRSKPLKLNRQINHNLAYILGAMLGDGHIGNRNQEHGKEVVFSDLDRPQISKTFQKKVRKVFNILPKNDKKKGLVYYSTALANVLNRIGIPGGNKANKLRVPKFIFFGEEKIIGAFLSGLFNADGSVTKTYIEISTSNKIFSHDLQWLLKRLSIISYICYRKQKENLIRNKMVKGRRIYSVIISGRRNIEKFIKVCKPNKEKCSTLIRNLKNTKRPYTRSRDIIPIAEGLKEAYKEYRKNKGKRLDQVLTAYGQNSLSIDNLLKILPKLTKKSQKAKELYKLVKLPIRWIKIKSLKKIKKKTKVYDLTIEGDHNFITNQLISHNTIQKDIEKNRISLDNVSLLVLDECHKSRDNYATTKLADNLIKTSKFPRILALTASPGSTTEKIEQICKNLFIEKVEIRTEDDEDIKEFIQEKETKWLEVDLPEELKKLHKKIKKVYLERLPSLRNFGLTKPISIINKRDLIALQFRLRKEIPGNKAAFWGISLTAQLLKLDYALELIETQGLQALQKFLEKLQLEETKAAKNILSLKEIQEAIIETNNLIQEDIKHPKLYMLKGIIKKEIEKNKNSRILVFVNYRNTIDEILEFLKKENISITKLIGQKSGLTQKEQISVIKEFELGKYNVLCTTSIGEEGIHVEAEVAVFYDVVPSEIRTIQRRGRVGRIKAGKIIFLVTNDTREQGYRWSAYHKENKMKKTLKAMQQTLR